MLLKISADMKRKQALSWDDIVYGANQTESFRLSNRDIAIERISIGIEFFLSVP